MKRWYVIQVYAGYENIVKADLLKRVQETGLESLFGDVLIPSAKMKQFFNTTDALQDQQLFPGYLLVELEPVPEALRLLESNQRVLRVLGTLSKREIERVQAQIEGKVVIPHEKHEFEVGKEVEINVGPFSGFFGVVDSVNEADKKLRVMVSIFGRMTPVELGFDQVKQ